MGEKPKPNREEKADFDSIKKLGQAIREDIARMKEILDK